MSTVVYTPQNLPPFKADVTSGYMVPAPGAPVAVVVAPASATISRPPSWGAGQDLTIEHGVKHIAQDGEGDSYPNQEFDTFYQITGELDPGKDDRAKFLVDFWAERGYADLPVYEAQKTRPALVVGEVSDEAVGSTFRNHEGDTEITEGFRILQSPDDPHVMWGVTPKVYRKKYANEGEILPGKPEQILQ